MKRPFIFLALFLGAVKAFLEGGFDPNAVNGFGPGQFNPNGGISTYAPPSIDGGNPESEFNPNQGFPTTAAPPEFNGFTGWAGSGNFDPNSGHLVATTSSPESEGFGGWSWQNGGSARKSHVETKSPFGNFENNYWGFATGSGGFVRPKTSPTTTTTSTTTTTTMHPTTPKSKPLVFGGKSTTLPSRGQRVVKNKRMKRHVSKLLRILELSPARGSMYAMGHILG